MIRFLENVAELLFISGFCFVLAALISMRFPPKKINDLYGYRSTASKKDQQSWDFAQKYSNKLMLKIGIIYLVLSLYPMVFKVHLLVELIFDLILLFIGVGALIYFTEKAIKSLKN